MNEPLPSETQSLHSPGAGGNDACWPTLVRLRAHQRQRWQQGERAPVEDYLEQQPTLRDNPEAVLDLIYNEMVLRSQEGEVPQLEDYQRRFPDLTIPLKDLFDVHRALETPGSATLAEEGGPGPASVPDESTNSLQTRPDADPHPRLTPRLAVPGEPLIPGYEILGELGRGGMGVVYKARHVGLDRLVALKMIRTGDLASPQELEHFRAEARIVARLEHPHIVQIHDVGEQGGRPYLALEFVTGGNLDEKLARTPLPAYLAAPLVETLARAMHCAHEKNIVHRDLKPANILLAPASGVEAGVELPAPSGKGGVRWVLKITDFGLAKRLDLEDGQTQSGVIKGTPPYMAPEQAAGRIREIGPATDVYALGAILYELLTGRPPFKGINVPDTLFQVVNEDPVPVRRLQPKVPRDLETICLKCLQKQPRKRYASALDLAEDLRRFQAGEPIMGRPVPLRERLWRWARRRPALATLIAVSTAAALALVIMGVAYNTQLRAALLTSRRSLYVAHLNLAQQAWRDARINRVLELLDRQRPEHTGATDLRGFEWYYLYRLCHSARLSVPGYFSVALSPDARRLVTVNPTRPREVVVWDTAARRVQHTLRGHKGEVVCVAFSPDGRSLASAGEDHTVRLWDVATGRARRTLTGHTGKVSVLAFSGDGRRLASGGEDQAIKVWDVTAGKEVHLAPMRHDHPITGLAFRPNSAQLASASDGDDVVVLWDTTTGGEVTKLDHPSPRGVAFSPDGAHLAVASRSGKVTIWRVNNEEVLFSLTIGRRNDVLAVAFSPDGQRLAAASWDRTVTIWDLRQGKILFTLRGHRDQVVGVAYSGDGRRVASVSRDQTVKVWDAIRDQASRLLLGHTLPVHGVAFSRDGRLASADDDGTIKLWNVRTGTPTLSFHAHDGPINGLAFSPDGRRLASASADWTIKLWDSASGRLLQTCSGHKGEVMDVAFSPDGRRLVSASADQTVRLWGTGSGRELLCLRGHRAGVNGVAFSPDGRWLASASADATVRRWDALNGDSRLELTGHTGPVNRLAFRPASSELVSAGDDQTLRIWDVESGRRVAILEGHTAAVNGLAFTHDGRRLASASADRMVKIWDMVTRQELLTLRGHAGSVASVAFSPDGHRLASGGSPPSARLRALARKVGRLLPREVRLWDAVPLPEDAVGGQ